MKTRPAPDAGKQSINLNAQIMRRDGEPMRETHPESPIVTLRFLINQTLDTPMQEDAGASRRMLMRIGMAIEEAEETIELSAEERTAILERARKLGVATIHLTRLYQHLDPSALTKGD